MAEYITKDAVISLAEKWSDGYVYIEIPVQDAIRQVSALPPAAVRPVVRGRWEPHPDPNCKEWDVCTACGTGCKRREYGTNPDGTDYVTEWSYPHCPNCGADMSIFMDRTEFLKFLDGQYMIGGDAE